MEHAQPPPERGRRLVGVLNVLIALALAVLAVLLYQRLSAPLADPVLEGMRVDLGGDPANRTAKLVMVLSASCKYCDESGPALSRIARSARELSIPVVVVSAGPEDEMRAYTAKLGLAPTAIHRQTQPEQLRVRGTPTTLLVGADGRVVRGWTGTVTSQTEGDLMKTLARTGRPSQAAAAEDRRK
jgi:hypothetical protein